MAPLTSASRTLARSAARCTMPVRALGTSAARLDSAPSSSYQSPFVAGQENKVPSFGKYVSKSSGGRNQLFSYFMVGTMGAISAAAAKSTIQGELVDALWLYAG